MHLLDVSRSRALSQALAARLHGAGTNRPSCSSCRAVPCAGMGRTGRRMPSVRGRSRRRRRAANQPYENVVTIHGHHNPVSLRSLPAGRPGSPRAPASFGRLPVEPRFQTLQSSGSLPLPAFGLPADPWYGPRLNAVFPSEIDGCRRRAALAPRLRFQSASLLFRQACFMDCVMPHEVL